MQGDVGVAVAVAGWMFTFLTALTLTGAVVPDSTLARATARRWWYIPPAVGALFSAVSVVTLTGLVPRMICLLAALLFLGILAFAAPSDSPTLDHGRRSSHLRDSREVIRFASLAAAVVLYSVGVYSAMRAGQL